MWRRDARRAVLVVGALACGAGAGAGCRQDMHDQPRADTLGPSAAFEDGRASRPAVEGTVARGSLPPDPSWITARDAGGAVLDALPPGLALDRALLERGRERYDIHCAPCHAASGDGDGMVVRRGFPAPRSLLSAAVRANPLGSYVDAIRLGFGRMPALAAQVPPRDRWAIAAWIRTLQLAARAPADALDGGDRARLAEAARDAAPAEPGR